MPITPEMLQNMGGGTQAVQPNRTAYADMIMKQLAQLGEPAISKSTSTSTLEGGGQGMDLGTLAMLIFFMMNQQKGQTTTSLGATAAPGASQYGNLPFPAMADMAFGE